MEPRRVEPRGQGEAVVAGLGLARVEPELPGVVPGAEEAGVLARPGERALDQPQSAGPRRWGCRRPGAAAGRARPRSRGSRRARRRGRGRSPPAGSTAGRSGRGGPRRRWFPSGCDIDRTIASWSARAARPGRCSQIRMPGTAVSIGLNSPRIAVGRLGLHVERVVLAQPAAEQDHDHRPRPPEGWPPGAAAARAASRPGSPMPSSPE